MRDSIETYLQLKGYSGAALNREINRTIRGIEANEKSAAETVGGAVLSFQVFKYWCGECGNDHFTKENSVEVCTMETKGE